VSSEKLAIFISQQKIELTLPAGRVGSTHAIFTSITDFIDAELSQILSKEQLEVCTRSVVLKSPHTFLSLDEETQAVFLKAEASTEVKTLVDPFLEFKIEEKTWVVPIQVTFTDCVVSSLSFARSSIKISHKIGSGVQTEDLPKIKQQPDCGNTFDIFILQNIQSTMAPE